MRVAFLVALWFVIANSLFADEQPGEKPAQQKIIRVSRATTFVTEPLTADGFPDYKGYLNRKMSHGVTNKDNAAIWYWKALGNPEGNVEFRKLVEKYWGMTLFDPNRQQIVGIGEFTKQKQLDAAATQALFAEQGRSANGPWTNKDMPLIAEWLRVNEAPLALVTEGTTKPHYFRPLVGDPRELLISTVLADVQCYRSFARLLAARSMLRLGSGDLKGSREDIMAMHRLSRHLQNSWTIIEMLVGVAIDAMATSVEHQMLLHGNLSAQELIAYRKEHMKLGRFDHYAETLDEGERLWILDAVIRLADSGSVDDFNEAFDMMELKDLPQWQTAAEARRWLKENPIDWNSVMIGLNRRYNRMVASARFPMLAERRAAMQRLIDDLKHEADEVRAASARSTPAEQTIGSRGMATLLSALWMPAVIPADEAQMRANAKFDVTQVGIAVLAYRADNGALPPSLAAMVPKYIDKIPIDAYSAEGLKYGVRGDEFAVYSVGGNLHDDGGITWGEGGDDQVFRTEGWLTPVQP